MGTSQSKSQSSLDEGTASIERSTSALSMSDHGGDKPSGVQLAAATTAKSNEDISTTISPQQQQLQTYTPPTSPIKPLAHYIFLVHGWLGNDLEYGYLAGAFQNTLSPSTTTNNDIDGNVEDSMGLPDAKRVRRSGSYQSQLMTQKQQPQQERSASDEPMHENNNNCDAEVVVHSVKCNVGKTHDGIRNGGARLANEIVDFIRSDVQNRLSNANDGESKDENEEAHITYSIVGNSLGGLYSRYAISLVPYQLQLNNDNNQEGMTSTSSKMLNIHPNIFCTTATPHLGISRHTYLPIPRIAEKIIGTGMGTTGRDLFRLNGDKDATTAAVAGNIMNAAGRGVQRLTSFRRGSKVEDEGDTGDSSSNSEEILNNSSDDQEECIIRNMCMQDKYLAPLRNFRQRIAYANAYGTDFQVPTSTAAFLHEKSGVGHFLIASRDLPSPVAANADAATEEDEKKNDTASSEGDGVMESNNSEVEEGSGEGRDGMPSFIIAVVRTEKQAQTQSPRNDNSDYNITADDELLQMSQSLDALGWTKVFIDVRDRIPMPGLAKPTWLRHPCGSLDDLIRERIGLKFQSLQPSTIDNDKDESATAASNGEVSNDHVASMSAPKVEINGESCILTSQELAASTNAGDSLNFPLGHTVMVANSKNEKYSQLNSQGRPVMDRLAEDMVAHVLGYE